MGDASPNLSKPLGTNLGADEVEAKGRFGGGMGDASPNLSKTLGTKKASLCGDAFLCAQSGNRTRTILLSQDFESSASTNSAIRAGASYSDGIANLGQNRGTAKFFSYLCSL